MSAVQQEQRFSLAHDDMRLLRNEMERVVRHQHQRTRAGMAAVCAAILPGLGHLFLLRYGWALIYAVGWGWLSYKGASAWLTGGSPEFWPILMGFLWIGQLIHAVQASASEEE